MIAFNGIFNDRNTEVYVRIYWDLDNKLFSTNMFMSNDEHHVIVNANTNCCTIDGTDYTYCISILNDEIIIAAKENVRLVHILFPCIYKRKYFAVSNKEMV